MDKDDLRKLAKIPLSTERSFSKNEASRRTLPDGRVRETLPRVPSRFSEEQIKAAGFRPVMTPSGHISVTQTGHPICIMERVVQDDSLVADRIRAANEELAEAAYALLGQLNEMNFQDHPRAEEQRLESRRRALLAALSLVENHKKNSSIYAGVLHDTTSRGRDLLSSITTSKLALAGGYRIEDLKKTSEEAAVLHGRVYIDGHYFHVVAVEVQDVNGVQTPVRDPDDWYGDIGELDHSALLTTTLPGFRGDCVLCIYPGGR